MLKYLKKFIQGKKGMRKAQNWEVRDGNKEDMEGILFLRSLVFGEEKRDKLYPRFWRWEFIENPHGEVLIYVVEDENRIVCHFADLPNSVRKRG